MRAASGKGPAMTSHALPRLRRLRFCTETQRASKHSLPWRMLRGFAEVNQLLELKTSQQL